MFNFKQRRLHDQYKHTANASSSIRSKANIQKEIQASFCGPGGGGNGGAGGGARSAGGGMSRYSGTSQSMELGNITQEWMPQDPVGLHTLWRQIYLHDSVGGTAIDLISALPWSEEWDLVGLKDPSQQLIFEKAMVNLQVETLMIPLTVEYLTIGRISASLLFDDAIGTWTGIMPHDPDFITITPREIFGLDPKLDMTLSPGLKKMLASSDERDTDAMSKIPDALLKQLKSGKIQLDPLNTLFVPRKTLLNDYVGTSLLTRLVPYYALEQNLITGTLIASRRRQRSILHLTVGLDDLWEPEPSELDDIVNLFMQADEDPQGAIVATRKGVEANEVRDGNSFWKISDEQQFLTESKMKALGINDAILSGDATYNNMETALSVFMETVRNLRSQLTDKIFYRKVFPTLSRVYGIRKINKNELKHRIRIKKNEQDQEREYQEQVNSTLAFLDKKHEREALKYNAILTAMKKGDHKEVKRLKKIKAEDAKEIPESELLFPQIHWSKQLRPEADENYLNILSTMEEKGIPIPLRTWASAGGIDLDRLMDMMKEDADLRKDIQDWKQSTVTQDENAFAAVGKIVSTKKAVASNLPLWKVEPYFMGISKDDVTNYIKSFADSGKFRMLGDVYAVEADLNRTFDHATGKVEAMKFILKRIGMVNFPLNREVVTNAISQLERSGLSLANLTKEVQVIQKYAKTRTPRVKDDLKKAVERIKIQDNFTGNNSTKLYSGL